MPSTKLSTRLKIIRFLFKMMQVTSWIGVALDSFALILLNNLGKDLTGMLLHLAMMLVTAYIAASGLERVAELAKEENK